MSYAAIVTRIKTRPHPNADRLQLGLCHGHQVVVGKEVQDGELGVFFPADGQLSHDMCVHNGLYSKAADKKLNPPYGTQPPSYGFFSEKRRVRAQSFRGEKSDGFWVPLDYLSWTGFQDQQTLQEGFTFTALNGNEVCCKYMTPATKQAMQKPGHKQRENRCFPKHDDTKQFRYVGDSIPSDAVLYITEKLHGTSGRYGLVLDKVELSRVQRGVNWITRRLLGVDAFQTREYRYLNGSKNVILEKTSGPGYYGTNDFRYRAVEGVTLHKGEVIYFEIVGNVTREDGSIRPIMDPQPVPDELKSLRKQYGDFMYYSYGVPHGLCDSYVYKILHVNEDGVTTDMPWTHVKARCAELGLKHVPELMGPRVMYDAGELLPEIVALLTEGPSTLDSGHIREGCVVRVESTRGIDYIKNKSWTFGVLEGYIKDLDSYVDTEESA